MLGMAADWLPADGRAGLAAHLSGHEVLWVEPHPVPLVVPARGGVCRGGPRRHHDSGGRTSSERAGWLGPRSRCVHRGGVQADRGHLRQSSVVLYHDARQRVRRQSRPAGRLGGHADPARPAASLFICVLCADDREPPMDRAGHRPRHPRRGYAAGPARRRGERRAAHHQPRNRPMDVLPGLQRDEEIHRRFRCSTCTIIQPKAPR